MLFPLNGISAWDSTNPVYFGRGLAKLVGTQMKSLGVTKVMIGCDQGIRKAGLADIVIKSCEDADLPYCIFDEVTADPEDVLVNKVAAIAKEAGIDGWIAIGGGSTMDTCKCANLLQKYEGPINRYFLGEPECMSFDERTLYPICVMPTTSGTGSEVSPGAVISDTNNNHAKRPVNVGVDLAIVDPDLTIGLPLSITVYTAVDAYAHCIEGVISSMPNIFSDEFGLAGVKLVSENLPKLVKDPANPELREKIAKASVYGGLALRGAFGGLAHRFGMGISNLFHKPHGLTVGLFLPSTIKFSAPVVPDKIRMAMEAMGVDVPADAAPEEIGQIAFDAIAQMMRESGFPTFDTVCSSSKELTDNLECFWTPAELTDPVAASCARLCQNEEEAIALLEEAFNLR